MFLKDFNNNIRKDYGVSRNDRFSEEEKHLQELPQDEFLIPEVKEATVHPDCHIQYGKSFYSVPWQYIHPTLDYEKKHGYEQGNAE